ncbi:MAG: nuclear transport factor 2 family protein [Myxococcales bacterium]|nr:nuclear transport factor 2 family protein [Myxococcales bacterium]
MIEKVVENWHKLIRGEFPGGLDELLAEDVVFYSPVVFTPQKGIEITKLYLSAAASSFGGETDAAQSKDAASSKTPGNSKFHYTKQILSGHCAMLEFETEMQGKYVNGVDILTCNDEGKIVEFKVLIRPLQAVNAVHGQMRNMLEKLQKARA